jgi:hypothetical protein
MPCLGVGRQGKQYAKQQELLLAEVPVQIESLETSRHTMTNAGQTDFGHGPRVPTLPLKQRRRLRRRRCRIETQTQPMMARARPNQRLGRVPAKPFSFALFSNGTSS